ncbi:alpha/beta-hydrolase [Plenodomus tracheiphilus IPT5]|uniref:Alpha/beta-hydrolase n=1 Tax=Plenodomus tracheiphilus IPT5 TaxID=1408161 RepID=A0A6A7BDD4_9PLEO|nr:alpha/beta-hydrolase [Plenodomus tracheiphilus IPT5]
MSIDHERLVLPRPGATNTPTAPPIAGPSEEAFTAAFGKLLPPAKFINTNYGNAAYYEILPSTVARATTVASTPERVLFIHGVQTPALGMLPLARALHSSIPNAHFVLVDLWGHGLSDTPLVAHEASLFHGLFDAVLDHLAWSTAHLVGFSFGGALTVGYVASRPSRVQSYTLVAPAGLIHSSQFTDEQRGYLRGNDETAAQKWVLSYLEGGELVVPSDWRDRVARGDIVAEAVREWQMCEHSGHTASIVAIFRDGGVMDNDRAFTAAVHTGIPSLAVLGELDLLCSAQQLDDLAFPNIKVVPQAGHGVVREQVPDVAGNILKFWMELG